MKTKPQLIEEVEGLLKSQNKLYPHFDMEQLLQESFARFATSSVEILREKRDYFIYVNVLLPDQSNVNLPLKILLSKHKDASPLEKF